MNRSSHSPRSIVVAIVIAASLLALDTVGRAQSGAYNPALEKQLWKELLPWGLNLDADDQPIWLDRRDLNNIPSSNGELTEDVNVYDDPVYRSIRPDGEYPYGDSPESAWDQAQLQFGLLVNEGECTFSHEADYDLHWSIYFPQVRLCKGPQLTNGQFAQLPPAPGRLLNPVGLATTGKKVFVTDLFNHRVQAFDFFGRHIPMKFPIGNGIPGSDAYDYDEQYGALGLNYRPYADVPGYENFGYSGYQVSAPAGIAVDARQVSGEESPRLLIADSDNFRVALFNDDGSPAFLDTESAPLHITLPVPTDAEGNPIQLIDSVTNTPVRFKPDQIAISSGAIVRAPGTEVLSGDPQFNKRIVVADRLHCYIAIMDVGFNIVKTLPPAMPTYVQHDACQNASLEPTKPGEFATITGVKVAADGTIYVVDNANNVIRVFDRDGNLIASIGQAGSNPGGDGDLAGPVGVFLDESFNRLGVIDGGNARAVFYDISNGPANVTYQFEIETTVAVDDFPMGVQMQFGAKADGLDPKGRIMVTDPYRRGVLRWELPELVIANAHAEITNSSADPRLGIGSFDVVVPYQKLSPVLDVKVNLQPAVGGVTVTSVTPSLVTRPDIENGYLVHYDFTFTSTAPKAVFNITAEGDCDANGQNCAAEAPEAEAAARSLCADCVAQHELFFDVNTSTPATLTSTPPARVDPETGRTVTGWYPRPVTVRITPVNPPGTEEDDPNKVVAIAWAYGGIAGAEYEPAGFREVAVADGGYVDVPVTLTGVSWITYKPITLGDAEGATTEVLLPLDLTPPEFLFDQWLFGDTNTPLQNTGTEPGYSNRPVKGHFSLTDPHSGPVAAPNGGDVLFTTEGWHTVVVPVQDRVGNVSSADSGDEARGGRIVKIDYTPATFEATEFSVTADGFDGADWADVPAGKFFILATDPLLADGQPGSRYGTWTVPNLALTHARDGAQLSFPTVDGAGNASTGYATLRVTPRLRLLPTLTVTGGVFDYTKTAHPASCVVSGENGTFSGTLTYSPGGTQPPVNGGTYTATCSFEGNDRYIGVPPAAATVTVNRINPTLVVTGGTSTYDALPRTAGCTVTGLPGDSLSGVVTYPLGSAPVNASTTIATCDFAGNQNYLPKSGTGTLVINKRPLTITADNQTKTIGVADPLFTWRLTSGSLVGGSQLTGYLARPAGVDVVGLLTGVINQVGSVAVSPDPANYAVTVVPGNLTIVALNLPPTAVDDAKSSVGSAPVTIGVLGNDSDPDCLLVGCSLNVVAFTQPTAGATVGTVTQSGNNLVFQPASGFVGVAEFTYTIEDGSGGRATATVRVTITAATECTISGFTTYTQGGWGATPSGNNPAMLLYNKFALVYPGGSVRIGGTHGLTFTSSTAIKNFLPAGGTASVLSSSASNPTYSSAGVFAGQVLALQLNVDFSNAGVTKRGLSDLEYVGYPVSTVLSVANEVLGGNTGILAQYGLTVSELNAIVDSLNNNFDNGTANNGLLSCPTGTCSPTTISMAGNSSTSGSVGNIRTFSAGSVSVKASAFSRVKTTGQWAPAYLGAFSPGLGVTDAGEGSGSGDSHKVDNIGDRQNYILFEFSKPVVVTRAYLDYVGADSDATIWIGSATNPFDSHVTLSDGFLSTLSAPQTSAAAASGSRWATFNGTAIQGNILVIAADVNDTTPEDAFKIGKLDLTCATQINTPPVVAASPRSNAEGDAVSVQFSATDADSDPLTFSATGLPPGLSMNSAGLVTGTLGYAAQGTYNVTVTVEDDNEDSASATFVWTVTGTNRPPVVSPSNRTDNKGTSPTVQITGSDPDGDTPLAYSATGLPPGMTMNSAGSITGTLTTSGTYTVTVTVKDPSNASGTGTFVWTVVNPNRPPTVSPSNRTDDKGASPTVQITGSDPDGDTPLTYSATGLPPGMTMNSAGKITGTLTTAGSYTVTVTVKDPSNASSTGTFVWTVRSANVAPDAKNDSKSTSKNTATTITVLSNDTDANGDQLTITSVRQPSNGSVTKNANGTLTFVPKRNWTGTTSFTYTISDGRNGSDTATVTVRVGSHSDNDDCDRDHDHDGDRDDDDDHRERDCDRDHRHSRDCERNRRR